jgi:hypothetical protein
MPDAAKLVSMLAESNDLVWTCEMHRRYLTMAKKELAKTRESFANLEDGALKIWVITAHDPRHMPAGEVKILHANLVAEALQNTVVAGAKIILVSPDWSFNPEPTATASPAPTDFPEAK